MNKGESKELNSPGLSLNVHYYVYFEFDVVGIEIAAERVVVVVAGTAAAAVVVVAVVERFVAVVADAVSFLMHFDQRLCTTIECRDSLHSFLVLRPFRGDNRRQLVR